MEPLAAIADNPVLMQALRDLLEKHFEVGVVGESTLSDEQLGQMFRARIVGLEKIKNAFTEIERLKTAGKSVESRNPAR